MGFKQFILIIFYCYYVHQSIIIIIHINNIFNFVDENNYWLIDN